jgi:pimeloyl-ACP methyl ester carboxylesterase/DNA-binding CsgD family transcriptional regulator
MDAPPVQYVTTSDGFDIAYSETGQGLPFVFCGTGFCHVQIAWQMPLLSDWLAALSSRFRLVQFDVRGAGMSTRGMPADFTLEHYQRDITAVVDALGLERFVLYGGSYHIGCLATQYAAENPERVAALILSGVGTSLDMYRGSALYDTIAEQDWDVFWQSLINLGAGAGDIERAQRIIALYKQAYGQHDFVLMARVGRRFQLTEFLPRLSVPTLVIDVRDFGILNREEPMKVARMAHAQLVTIDGTGVPGDLEQGMRAIEAFVAELPETKAASGAVAAEGAPSGLSTRELEVLRLLAAGRSNQQIADELVISLNTVRRHVSNVFDKTGAANRAQATAYAKDHGLA